ncbi:hypothetical protein CA13_06800 [Planctomycetes bacterium CA13]|uniref:PEP-CTERM protein-sorting domain-containing protein n=2 Tax=Novipirellula herctigrandis TaxID=2527986 RepID=A0A5C5YW53_9BACT|nr:hypothetical protein CA13_06800 [Planctomycetes bacterium CA13]
MGTVNGLNAGLAVQYGANDVTARVSIMGDADFSDSVGNADIGAVFGSYQSTTDADWTIGDFDGDLDVDNADIGVVFGNFGATLPPQNALISSAAASLLSSDLADLIYNPRTGAVMLDGSEADGGRITNFVLESDDMFINTGALSNPFDGFFFTANAGEISASDPLATGLASIDFGSILAPNLTYAELVGLFERSTYVGELGTGVQSFDFVVTAVPEPTTSVFLLAAMGLRLMLRRRKSPANSFPVAE